MLWSNSRRKTKATGVPSTIGGRGRSYGSSFLQWESLIRIPLEHGVYIMRDKTVDSYSTGSKGLHWIVAILVLMMLSFGFFLDDLPEQFQSTAFMMHKSIGLTIFFLMLARLFWIVHTGKPELPFSVPRWERIFSQIIQVSMYVCLIAMPLAGWVKSVAEERIPTFFGLFPMPLYGIPVDKTLSKWMGSAHEIIAYILIALITFHIAGALKHHFIDKDKVMRRMLSNARKDL